MDSVFYALNKAINHVLAVGRILQRIIILSMEL